MDQENKGKVPSGSTQRWVLVPDDESPRRLLWEWEPFGEDDIDALFARVDKQSELEDDHELFAACVLDRFIGRVTAGEPIEPWILRYLADTFARVLMGGEWNDEIHLPGRQQTPIRSWRDQRDFEIYCLVANAVNLDSANVTEAIKRAAEKHAVSYETARSGYYRWEKEVSRKMEKP